MSTGGKVCAETASESEKLSHPAKNGTATQQHLAKLTHNSQFDQTSFPFCQAGGVEVWRGGVGEAYPLADPFVGRCLTSLAVPLIPHPAHRTGRAERPHPALGERLTVTPTENCSSVW